MASTSSSVCLPIPAKRSAPCIFSSVGGNGIFTLGLPKNPFSTPSLEIAAADPSTNACFNPATASAFERLPIVAAIPQGLPISSDTKASIRNTRVLPGFGRACQNAL
jgi:hypothetical protein